MGLKVFGPDGPKTSSGEKFSDDVVGRFRSGHQTGTGRKKTPQALSEWRVTTGDPNVAEAIHGLLGGEAPEEWDAVGEDNLEVFTDAPSIKILLGKPSDLRQAMILWGRNGMIYKSDGETISHPEDRKGDEDPDAGLSMAERKAKDREGTGASPQIEIYFRLAEDPDLGIFKFQTGSWSMVSDFGYDGTDEKIERLFEDGAEQVSATLRIEEVSFEAKSGPRAGQTVTFFKPVLDDVEAA